MFENEGQCVYLPELYLFFSQSLCAYSIVNFYTNSVMQLILLVKGKQINEFKRFQVFQQLSSEMSL